MAAKSDTAEVVGQGGRIGFSRKRSENWSLRATMKKELWNESKGQAENKIRKKTQESFRESEAEDHAGQKPSARRLSQMREKSLGGGRL